MSKYSSDWEELLNKCNYSGQRDRKYPCPPHHNCCCCRGPQGPAGPVGTILGSYDTVEALRRAHPTGSQGDAYLVGGELYVWNEDTQAWESVGNLQGPAGDSVIIRLNGSRTRFLPSQTSRRGGRSLVVRKYREIAPDLRGQFLCELCRGNERTRKG